MVDYLDKINKLSFQKRMEYLILDFSMTITELILMCSGLIIAIISLTMDNLGMRYFTSFVGAVSVLLGWIYFLQHTKKLDKHYFGGKK